MKGRIGRKLGGTSVVAVLVGAALALSGMSIALADSVAMLVESFSSGEWAPPSAEPSGAAWIGPGGYLFVVDTNVNNPSANGWEVDVQTGDATSRATGVVEPTGIDYDPDSNTLFISSDTSSGGFIAIVRNFDTPSENRVTIDTDAVGSFDTEDPAYNRNNDRLYWIDGEANALFELNPVNGIWGDNDDIVTERSVTHLNSSSNSDWEGLAWDPNTGFLLVANTLDQEIYEVTFANPVQLEGTIDATGIAGMSKISGMGIAPSSFIGGELSLWTTDRDTSSLFEITFDGTVPPSTTTTSTTQPTTTSSTQGSTTSSTSVTTSTSSTSTTSSTSSTSTTTTTTTMGTTTTTTPGSTTTTTQPGGGGGGTNPFIDDDGSVFETSIEWLAAAGITQGCNPPLNNRFCPNDRVTRGQMATFLVRALDYPGTSHDWFIDDEGSVFENSINRLREAGVTQGCNPPDNSRYCPNAFVTRGQMAAFLDRAFGYSAGGSIDYFTDDNGHVFENAINRLRTARVTLGCNPPSNNRYCPNDFVTRGQMAAFLKRAMGG